MILPFFRNTIPGNGFLSTFILALCIYCCTSTGSMHDAMTADIVGLDQLIQENMTHDGVQYNLFLDAAYPIGRAVITPFRRVRTQSRDELEWNR